MKKWLFLIIAGAMLVACDPQDNPGSPDGTTGIFTDARDGNVYKTIQIGSQTWMAENLRYLPENAPLKGPKTGSLTSPYCYIYGYDGTNIATAKAHTEDGVNMYQTYGVLYNWPAAMNGAVTSSSSPSGVRGICPQGWHLPSDAEWKKLEMHLGMTQEEADQEVYDRAKAAKVGAKMKETGQEHWKNGNTDATNSSGFSGRPAGMRDRAIGQFLHGGTYVHWWTSTQKSKDAAYKRALEYYHSGVSRVALYKDYGFSVRCVKN